MIRYNLSRRMAVIVALLAGTILIPGSHAQPTEQTVQSRFLFVFDTAHDMKSRTDSVEKTLNILLALSLNGQMHAGDSMGVWTFGQQLRPSDYPLQNWNPDNAAMIASNLVMFVDGQHYAKSTRFEALQPLLNEVVKNSQRLTVLIFCDGEAKFSGTPFDAGINQVFDQKRSVQKEAGDPFVIVLRSQLGQYVGCSVGLPPMPLAYPQFPPLPVPPPPPKPKATNLLAPAPVVLTQPLIIIGNKPDTSPPPAKVVATNPPAAVTPAKPEVRTNAPVPTPAVPMPTNPVAQTTVQTNAVPSPSNAGSGNQGFLIIGSGLIGAAIALGLVFWLRPRPKDPSLISRSMNDRK